MAYQVNQHVERLDAYQPFDASFDQLYAEYADTRQTDQLETKALEFVSGLLNDERVRLVVLTGDAGHGKTHLCGQLLTANDESITDPRDYLRAYGDGHRALLTLPDGRGLHVVKDLSEIDPAAGVSCLEVALSTSGRVTVVCANEGKLRAVLGSGSESLDPIREALRGVLLRGQTSQEGNGTHVVDLNHQSVAAPGGRSLVRQALRSWASDGRKWSACDQCDARDACPILENHRLLAAEDELGESRRTGVEVLLRVVEQTGHVVTIRELLILVAHSITGGLRCTDVHERARRGKEGWQGEYLFHQVMFGVQLHQSGRDRLSVFRALAMLDPGKRAIRPVDDNLLLSRRGTSAHRFRPAMQDEGPSPKNHQQLRRHSQRHREVYGYLRREAYFECQALTDETPVPYAERLGLRFYNDFEQILKEDSSVSDLVPVRNTVLAGLEAVQGARRPPGAGTFVVVDSAFASHRGSAAVVARRIMSGSVYLISQSDWWAVQAENGPNLHHSVDWIDRRVFVLLERGDSGIDGAYPLAVDLDCRQFEFVCRSARGLTSRSFFQADIRRVMGKLADLAQGASATEEITVLFRGRTSQLVIDVGDVIQATGS